MDEPWQIFRYRPINEFLWQELELAQFYCCSPLALNDPFDCRIDWGASLQRALASPRMTDDRRKRLSTLREKFLSSDPTSEAGICCFTCKVDDHLMWAHYADSHRGVCLLYEIPHDYFMRRYSSEIDKDFFFVGGGSVSYRNNAFYDWLITGDLDVPHPGSVADNAMTVLFTAKAREWIHEEEYRIVTRRPGRMAFEPSFLKQVVFGIATPEQQRKLVAQVARRANTGVVLSEVRRSPDSDFGMVFPEIAD